MSDERVTTATVEAFLRDLVNSNKGIPLGRYEEEKVLRDLLDARKRIEYTQPLVDAIFWIIDSLDDPYEGDGDSWQACTQEQCAGEFDRIRAALVPATGEFLAARAAEGGGDE